MTIYCVWIYNNSAEDELPSYCLREGFYNNRYVSQAWLILSFGIPLFSTFLGVSIIFFVLKIQKIKKFFLNTQFQKKSNINNFKLQKKIKYDLACFLLIWLTLSWSGGFLLSLNQLNGVYFSYSQNLMSSHYIYLVIQEFSFFFTTTEFFFFFLFLEKIKLLVNLGVGLLECSKMEATPNSYYTDPYSPATTSSNKKLSIDSIKSLESFKVKKPFNLSFKIVHNGLFEEEDIEVGESSLMDINRHIKMKCVSNEHLGSFASSLNQDSKNNDLSSSYHLASDENLLNSNIA
ncbi:hypothetical protein HK099_007371 [Clydaea vesicula]|uniref:Uncharacterized protein n=1 Tax=Clydaea vesicula TaxID=447962 RepID=A0AAD5U1C9_9FUNG|nr:hypothetical protein HK099_007371 [Clydaea vesicula]KAJ3393223.1 hypothetical protein HDU92_007918 [Lobulomyces angularis]